MMWEVDESTDLWADTPAARGSHGEGERFVTGELTSDDLDVERSLRPQRLDDYCGQEHIKQSLKILIEAAQTRGESLDHVIFSGAARPCAFVWPARLGKDHVGGGRRE